ncbi:MAG TPA: hypothetical protein VLG41_18575 [Hydrogenophaga sp.]|uniref:hypothetical protein n=1 Tax=Hydrogenophaga sp. TaxID=1904254 RepID=UPI002C34EB04|nr:hypothetical protein [Hydrogenophaga sp.]HSX94934.1 hypothetical protein [Hydrogenophaga sp.]
MRAARQDHTVSKALSTHPVPHIAGEQKKNQRFTLLPPERPRTTGEKTSFKTLFVRIAYPLLPKGPRTVTGSRDTHEAMRAFLAAVKAGPMTDKEVEQHLANIGKASRPLRGSDSKLTAEVFKQCLEMQLHALPLEDLKQLCRQVDKASPGTNSKAIKHLGDKAHEECLARLRSDLGDQTTPSEPGVAEVLQRIVNICDEALSDMPNDPAAAADVLRTLEGRTLSLVGMYGLKRPGADEFALSIQLLKEIFALQLLRNGADADKLRQIFLVMQPAMRAELRAAPANRFPDAIPFIDTLLDQTTAMKHDQLEASLVRACADFETSAKRPNNLEEQSAHLGIVIAQAKALDAHCDVHKASTGRGIGDKAHAVLGSAREAADRMDLSNLDPTQLSDQALHRLDTSFEALEIKDHAPQIQAEKARRKARSNEPFHLAAKEALNSLAKGDLAAAVKHLNVMQQYFDKALKVHLALGERAHDLDGRSELFARLLNEFFSSQPESIVKKWASALQSDQVLLLAEALEAFGREGLTPNHEKVGQIGARLTLLRVVLNPPGRIVMAQHLRETPGTLNETTLRLLKTLTGADLEPAQDAMKHVLDEITRSVRDDATANAWNDVTKAVVKSAMEDIDDGFRSAMDRILEASIRTDMTRPSSSQRTHYVAAEEPINNVAQLHHKLTLTTAQLQSLAKLANTDLWKSAKVNQLLASSEHTPVRLPDGSPLLLDAPEIDDTYRITQGSDGQLHVLVERVHSKALDAVNMATGKRAEIDREASTVTLSVGLTLYLDGSLSIAEPVSCDAQILPKASIAS